MTNENKSTFTLENNSHLSLWIHVVGFMTLVSIHKSLNFLLWRKWSQKSFFEYRMNQSINQMNQPISLSLLEDLYDRQMFKTPRHQKQVTQKICFTNPSMTRNDRIMTLSPMRHEHLSSSSSSSSSSTHYTLIHISSKLGNILEKKQNGIGKWKVTPSRNKS